MANEPAYWNQLTFVDQNGAALDHTPEQLLKQRKLINRRAGIELSTLSAHSAGPAADVFAELKARIEANCTAHPYTSQKQEATRMAWARSDIGQSTDAAHVLSAAMRLREGEKDGPPVPSVNRIVVKRIVVLRNQARWDAYDTKRTNLLATGHGIGTKINSVAGLFARGQYLHPHPLFPDYPFIDRNVAETFLFHGTDATRFIVETNIDPSRGRNKGTALAPNYGLLGQGAYFSDQIAKSATYTLCRICKGFACNCTAKDGDPVLRVTLLARVLLGKIHNAPTGSVAWDRESLRTQTYNTPIKATAQHTRHSILAAGSGMKVAAGSNEFSVRAIDQIYPEFIVYWHHPVPSHPFANLWDNASRIAMQARVARRNAANVARARALEDIEDEQNGLMLANLFS